MVKKLLGLSRDKSCKRQKRLFLEFNKKGEKLYAKWKRYDNSLIGQLMVMMFYEMSQYLHETI